MLIKKALASAAGTVTDEDLKLINTYALQPMTAEQVFVFSVKLCDNAPDRDNECFPLQTLKALQPLYVGKPGIFDHCWSAKGQTARIYRTELIEEPAGGQATGVDGETYTYLKAWAYIVKTEGTEEIISQISGGILKEVSVGCAVQHLQCSICGNDVWSADCSHSLGQEYDGKTCLGLMLDATDAYEWSFVAVPAQPAAGVTKGLKPDGESPSEDSELADMEDILAIENLRFGG